MTCTICQSTVRLFPYYVLIIILSGFMQNIHTFKRTQSKKIMTECHLKKILTNQADHDKIKISLQVKIKGVQ